MNDANATGWRETINRHHAALLEDLSGSVAAEVAVGVERAVADERQRSGSEMARAVAEERERCEREMAQVATEERARARNGARRKLSEALNQTLRRIRQTAAEHETLQLLLEESISFVERAVVVLIENNQVSIAAWRGAALTEEDQDNGTIDIAEAAALKSCVETRDPLVVIASPMEVSPLLARALSTAESDKIYLFPITARQTVVAVLLASGEVTPVPVELLCEAAGMKVESLDAATPAKPAAPPLSQASLQEGLVQIAGAVSAGKASPWQTLGAEEQAMHLRAQRMAKVRVAQMRISESDDLRRGIQTQDIYGALRISIDTARDDYRETYMSAPGMVDYLHLEIIRSLAREDPRLLGQGYPGPISSI